MGYLEKSCGWMAEKLYGLSVRPLFVRLILSRFKQWSPGDVKELYVLGGTVLLTILLLVCPRCWPAAVLASYRIFEILSYRAYFLLVKSVKQPWNKSTVRRSLLFLIMNYWEVVVGYALIYGSWGRLVNAASQELLLTPIGLLYYSLITIATVGYGDVVPGNDLTRLFVISEIVLNFLFIAFLIPALIAAFAPQISAQADSAKR